MSFVLPVAIPPGETIKESLEMENMSQKELALRLGMSEKHLISVLSGKSPVTAEIAVKLEKIIGGSAQFWMNSENSYQLAKLKQKEIELDKKQEEIARTFSCYGELAKAGFVKPSRTWGEKTQELLRFFKLPDLGSVFKLYPEVLCRNADDTLNKESLVSWLRCGDLNSEKLELEKYNKNKLESLIPEFKKLTHCPEGFEKTLQKMCAKVGVAIVFVPYFKNTKVNGATRWIRKNKNPLIQLNTKGASADIFWFTFFHELGHVLKHGKAERFIETSGEISIDNIKEQEADEFAEETLIPKKEFEIFTHSFDITSEDIKAEATKWEVHPSIVRGRLAKQKIIEYSQFREHCISLKIG